jgi:predicted RNA binding protein YcfA (HicA-like mRNA interferase family)
MAKTAILWSRLIAASIRSVKVRELVRLVEEDGWVLTGFTGSHRQYTHPTKSGKVTIPGHPSTDLHPKTAKSILQQAGLRP